MTQARQVLIEDPSRPVPRLDPRRLPLHGYQRGDGPIERLRAATRCSATTPGRPALPAGTPDLINAPLTTRRRPARHVRETKPEGSSR